MIKKIVACPNCKGRMEITNEHDLQVMTIKCPNPVCGAGLRIDFSEELNKTQFADNTKDNSKAGILKRGSYTYPLQEGKNIVGRSSASSNADVQIVTSDLSMSREHAEIEVVKLNNGRVKAILSDIRSEEKIKLRPITVDDEPLSEGDRIVLSNGDTIVMGETELRYEY